MRFAQIARGARATTRALLPIEGQSEPVPVVLRVLSADERARAVANGKAYAESKGVKDPQDGNEVFGIGVQANTLALCCMDSDAPSEPFFASTEEVLTLDPESIVFLYTHWQLHQDAHAPQRLNLSVDEYFAKVVELAEADNPDPFVSSRPSLQWSLARIMARQLVSYWTHKSPSGSFSAESTASAMKIAIDETVRAAVSTGALS